MKTTELLPIQFPKESYLYGQRSDGEIHGVVLTKPHIVELILDLAGYTKGNDLIKKRLLEPSCGHGAFLVPAVQRLLEEFKLSDGQLSDLKECITAFDIDPDHVRSTKSNLVEVVCSYGYKKQDAARLVENWIFEGDFLLATPKKKFDFVVGNPPYIRIENISPDLQQVYRKKFKSLYDRADLYVAFIEYSLSLVSQGGTLSFICADRWILNKYGAPLRNFITEGYNVKTYIDLHQASPFFSDVIAYPSIFVISPGPQETVDVLSLQSADTEEVSLAAKVIENQTEGTFSTITYYRSSDWFKKSEPWTLTSGEQRAVLKDLESRFEPIEHDDRCKVKIGVATGNDSLYIVGEDENIEADRLLPLVMRADLENGKINNSRKFVINTFNENGVIDLSSYPLLKKYFAKHDKEIKARHVAKKNATGWFRTIDRVYPELQKKPKLLIPDIAGSNAPTFDKGRYYPHHNLYFIVSDKWDLEVLGALLSSRVSLFFIWSYAVKMRGGYLRFQAQYLRRIRVPRPEDISENLANDLKMAFRKRDFKEIDRISMKVYGLKELPPFEYIDSRA